MDSKLTRWCDGLIEAGWLVAVIATPLFFNIHSDRVFEPDKLTLLRSIALAMGAAWIVKSVDQRIWEQGDQLRWQHQSSFWRRPFTLVVALLAAVYIVSNIFSVTPSISWAGSYQRLQGTYTTLSYIVIFGVTISSMRTQNQLRRLATAVIITSIPISFYGLLQHFSLDPLPWAGSVTERIAGQMGNAIFIAAYLIMAVPLTLGRIIASFSSILNDEELATADVIRSSIYIFTLAIQLIAIYWSGSRGPWLGLAIGLFAFILIVLVALRNASADRRRFRLQEAGKGLLFVLILGMGAYFLFLFILRALTGSGQLISLAGAMTSFVAFVGAVGTVLMGIFIAVALQRGWRWLWFSWIALSMLLAGWLILFNLTLPEESPMRDTPVVGVIFQTMEDWRELPRIGRLGTILEAEGGTGRVRVLIWQGVLDLITPHEPLQFPDGGVDIFNILRPVIGYGPEAMYVAYNRYYPPELATLEARNASPDRAHNETFDALVITGLAGFFVWQALYLSVFYHGFKWLGVLRHKRDRNILIGLWIGMGVLFALLFALWRGPEYVGVALPFGSIAGVIIYLIYYALVAEPPDDEVQPFAANRLFVIALVTAVLAHYVEIHFGIAIAATRAHFFLYIAGLYFMTSVVPQLNEAAELPAQPTRRARRGRQRQPKVTVFTGLWGTILLNTLIVALMIGIMGFTYTTFSPPPEMQVQTTADLTTGDIFQQSFFVNTQRNFSDSPFLFLMVMLTWVLGVLVAVSEMAKDGGLNFGRDGGNLKTNRRLLAASLLTAFGVLSIGLRLLTPMSVTAGATILLGRTLTWVWGGIAILAGARLFMRQTPSDRFFAGGLALAGLVFTLPVLIAGNGFMGLLLLLINAAVLYLIWAPGWRLSLLPIGVLAFSSLAIGLLYIYFQAAQLRYSVLYRFFVPQPETADALHDFLIAEAGITANFLVYFYIFVFMLMVLVAFVLALNKQPAIRYGGSRAAYGVLLGLLLITPTLIFVSNIRVIQADIVYKRGKFYDTEATRAQDVGLWDSAIAIYKNALQRTPREDFYYLFLGRAYLERSAGITADEEQSALLGEAENQLLRAQNINPLNTDHTANLARLNTRWAESGAGDNEARLTRAEAYYQDAISLSPRNAVIRNEYARITYALRKDCEGALSIYTESAAQDPFYSDTFFGMADTLVACAEEQPAPGQEEMYRQAVGAIESGLLLEADNARAWLRAGQLYHQLLEYQEALDAYEQIAVHDPLGVILPDWNINFLRGRVYNDMGNYQAAIAAVEEAIATAPADVIGQLQLFLNEIETNINEGEGGLAEGQVAELPSGERPLAQLPPNERNAYFAAYPEIIIDLEKEYQAVIITEKGELRLDLFGRQAPIAVNNFVFLATQGYYDGTTFHRVIANFMAQGGDPTASGTGYPGYYFEDELNTGMSFDRPGLLAMANIGRSATNGSQFFITSGPQPALDGRHTIFGEMVAGADVLNALTLRDPDENPTFAGDLIQRIDIVELSP